LNTALYVVDFHGNDERFAYYMLKCFDFKRYNSGSAQPSLNRNFVHPTPVDVPPLAEQRTIAAILGALDDKIELNRRMSHTLEQIARAIFQSWFVDFDPVWAKKEGQQPAGMDVETAALFPDDFEESELGLIPKGWDARALDDTATFLNGLPMQKYPVAEGEASLPVIKIAELHNGIGATTGRASLQVPSDYVVDDGDVLFSWSGSLDTVIWSNGKGALNQHLFKVTSDVFPRWFFYEWLLEHLPEFRQIASGKATTMGHIQRHDLDVEVGVPNGDMLARLDRVCAPLWHRALRAEKETLVLARLRDALLSKLVSGELQVRGDDIAALMEVSG
jgi:type I restriction enzyme S subunit